MSKVIILNGSGGVGKDTFVSLLSHYYSGKVYNHSSIEEAKRIATFCGWKGEKTNRDRKFLSDVKRALTEWRDIPYRQALSFYEEHKDEDCIIFFHIREPDEITKIVSNNLDDCITVLVTNKNVEDITGNPSDAGVYNYSYDYIVDNSGTLADFGVTVLHFANKIGVV